MQEEGGVIITQLTRFRAKANGAPEDLVKNAKQAKAHWEKHGAEYVGFSRFHTGPWAGEWLFVVRFPSWTAFGKAQEETAKDAAFQKLLAHVLTTADMMGRTVLTGVDL
jgi:hypothetical protein